MGNGFQPLGQSIIVYKNSQCIVPEQAVTSFKKLMHSILRFHCERQSQDIAAAIILQKDQFNKTTSNTDEFFLKDVLDPKITIEQIKIDLGRSRSNKIIIVGPEKVADDSLMHQLRLATECTDE